TAALPPKPATPAAPAGALGAFRIQLGSLGDQAAANAEWKRLARVHADILGGMPHAIERVDLANLGTRYRIQAGSFTDRAGAVAACERIRAKAPTQGCIVAAR
ncbi:MAG: SPOR domain-containing protein, partial [Alphaproteobacteria bacterium]|nr:SPOR domain-containing protein [Alphaproteobacteria bacterium]